ncbi:MAG: SDR family oxidoreductase [Desulfobacterota bacterium]|nr:SDR family oxidoreductase [Thermodesulfobacteriota bacterium]
MKNIVITGSSQGIGLGLAEEFLKRSCCVMLSARSEKRLEQERKRLADAYGAYRVAATPCDVTDYAKVQMLWDAAVRAFATVDIWINNAGIMNTTRRYWELDQAEIAPVVNTNIIGVMYGSHVALRGMIKQGHGQIYNLEGMGSNDSMRPGFTVYGTTKRAVRYFTESLVEEARDLPVQIGTIGPGIVVTEFLIENMKKMPPEEYQQVRMVYNILADKVETVAPFLVEHILANTATGAKIDWLTDEKAMERFNSDEYATRDLLVEFGL